MRKITLEFTTQDSLRQLIAKLNRMEEKLEPMDDNCPAARIGELGNQAHNLGCGYQNDEDLSDELGRVAVMLWDLANKAAIRTHPASADDEGSEQ